MTKLRARHPIALIGELAGRDVLVTLHLASGRDVRGTLVDVAHDRAGSVALIGNVRVPSDVTHVSLGTLEAVTVHDAHLVSAPPVPDPEPGKLEVRRWIKALDERFAAAGVPISFAPTSTADELPGAMLASMPALEEALLAIAKDEMGNAALAQITSVTLAVDATAGVQRAGGTLAIVLAQEYRERPSPDTWRTSLEAVL